LKKLLYGFLGFLLFLVFALVGALLFAGKVLTPEFLVTHIESAINARAHIEKVNINLVSVLSSIEIEGIQLARRDSIADNATPLADRKDKISPLLALGKADVKISFLSLLQGKFQLNRLILDSPTLNLILFEDGSNNLQSLFKAPTLVKGQPNPSLTPEALAERKKEEEEKKAAKADEPPSEPFTAKDLPVAIRIGEVGVKNANLQITMQKTGQVLLLQPLDFSLEDIDIDGKDLANHNSVSVDFDMSLLVIGKNKEESAKFLLESEGSVAPFVVSSGLVNPVVNYRITMLKGSFLSGFAAFDAIAGELPLLKQAGLKMDKIAERADLTKDVTFNVRYGNGRITFLDDPTFPTKNYDLQIQKESWIQATNNQHEMNMGILYDKAESQKSIAGVDAQIQTATKGNGNPSEIRGKILGNLIKEDRIQIPFRSSGDLRNPRVDLGVEVGSLSSIMGDAVKGAVKGKIGEELKKLPGSDALKKLF